MKNKALLPLALAIGFVSTAQANDESSLMLGLGIGSGESIYKGVKDETSVIPVFAYENGSFFVHGPELGYNFIESEELRVAAILRYRMEGFEAKDSTFLTGMAERKGALELGISASYETEYGDLSATFATDVSSEHKGHELKLGWENRIRLSSNWSVTPEASISYRSDDLNNYYFGVKESEATATRAAYKADSGVIYAVGVNADYMLDQQQMIRFGVSYQNFGSEISDSSIVEDDSSVSLSAMYIYRF